MTKKTGPIVDLNSLANVIAQWADQRPAVEKVYIFGSHVRGDARPDSDLDIAIDFVQNLTIEAMAEMRPTSVSDLKRIFQLIAGNDQA